MLHYTMTPAGRRSGGAQCVEEATYPVRYSCSSQRLSTRRRPILSWSVFIAVLNVLVDLVPSAGIGGQLSVTGVLGVGKIVELVLVFVVFVV